MRHERNTVEGLTVVRAGRPSVALCQEGKLRPERRDGYPKSSKELEAEWLLELKHSELSKIQGSHKYAL